MVFQMLYVSNNFFVNSLLSVDRICYDFRVMVFIIGKFDMLFD